MRGEQQPQLGPQRQGTLDVLWVTTVSEDSLHPRVRVSDLDDPISYRFDPDAQHPVHGTLTVDVRDARDRALLERLLRTSRVLSVTAADGWTQRVRLTGLRCVDTELQPDGSQIAVATYTWMAAASTN